MSATEPAYAPSDLANLILALLAPMFLWSTAGDLGLAYSAAAQTMKEYRVTNHLSLMTVAKIIAFDIATLSSLSLSMYEDVSMILALRLRGNANSLERSGERNRRALEQADHSGAGSRTMEPVEATIAKAEQMVRDAKVRMQAANARAAGTRSDADPAPAAKSAASALASAGALSPAGPSSAGPSSAGPSSVGPSAVGPSATGPSATGPSATGRSATGPYAAGSSAVAPSAVGQCADVPIAAAPVAAAVFAGASSATAPRARTSEEQHRAAWANAMTMVAEEFTAGLKDLPPAERGRDMARIAALTATAGDLVSGTASPPILAP